MGTVYLGLYLVMQRKSPKTLFPWGDRMPRGGLFLDWRQPLAREGRYTDT